MLAVIDSVEMGVRHYTISLQLYVCGLLLPFTQLYLILYHTTRRQ